MFAVAVAVWAVDSTFFEQPRFSLLGLELAGAAMLWLFLRHRNKWHALRQTLTYAALCVLTIAAVRGARTFNNMLAEKRLNQVVAALELYRVQNGHYPSDLSGLTPVYLQDVPLAKYTWRTSQFNYRLKVEPGTSAQISVELEDGVKKIYDLKTKRWAYNR